MLAGFLGWAGVLFAQNYSFTYVSRARNSGSLMRHFKAAIFSNGIWIVSQILMLGPMFDNLTGKHGLKLVITSGAIYTVSTVAGSLTAHFVSKRTEKGKNAVGANALYAQVPVAEYAVMQKLLKDYAAIPADSKLMFTNPAGASVLTEVIQDFGRVKGLAEQAFDITVGMIPDSGIRATKVAGEVIKTGL